MTSALAMPAQSDFHPLGAGAYLLSVLAICVGIGALIGGAAAASASASPSGRSSGVPASVAAVIVRYRDRGVARGRPDARVRFPSAACR